MYESCSDGKVPFLITPMSNFLEFAIRLQNKRPRPIDYMAESPCGIAYLDARSIIRGYRPTPRDENFFDKRILFVSTIDDGELIAQVDAKGRQTDEARVLKALATLFGPREIEIFPELPSKIPVKPGLRYAIFSTQACQITIGGRQLPGTDNLIQAEWVSSTGTNEQTVEAICPSHSAGWARASHPAYMGL
jgi:hypothetical protein